MTTYQEQVQEDILFQLSNEVMDTQLLSDRTGIPYATVRKALVQLVHEGKVIKFDKKARGARYSLAPDDNSVRTLKTIPNIMFKNKSIPLTEIYLGQGLETLAAKSVNDFLQAWTTIGINARRLAEGTASEPLVKRLNRERVSLNQARTNLEQLLFIFNQVLDNEKLWDPVHLANFVNDPDWDSFVPHLEELWSHYFGGENNG